MTIESSTFLPCSTAPGTLIIETSGFRLTRVVEGEKAIMKKAVRQDCNEDKTLRASLRKEYETGRVVSKQTPYIVNYLSFADTPAECYIKMDYIDGETLDNFITRHPTTSAVRTICGVSSCSSYQHSTPYTNARLYIST